MRHLDLFSGIGGFAMAALQVWREEYECVGFCDIEPYAQQLLKIRFPGVPIYDNIKTLDGTKIKADILTGGFPCQPFSMAGKRRGTEDDRYLWPEMLRVIQETKPTWVIGENVFGLLSMALGQSETDVENDTDTDNDNNREVRTDSVVGRIVSDLDNIGYDCEVLCIPAAAVNAPHRRDRLWFIGHTKSERYTEDGGVCKGQTTDTERGNTTDKYGFVADPRLYGHTRGHTETRKTKRESEQKQLQQFERKNRATRHPKSAGQPSGKHGQGKIELWRTSAGSNWLEVATRLCGVDDGLPAGLDGFKLSKAGHRVARLKGLGNAIVPQVVLEIMRAIKEADDAR